MKDNSLEEMFNKMHENDFVEREVFARKHGGNL